MSGPTGNGQYRLSAVDPAAADGESPVTARLAQLRGALLDSAALDSIPAPAPVIDGLLYRDGIAWLYGKPGTYKSIIALDWACCVSLGLPWQGRGTVQGPVLYVYAEGKAGLPQRVRAWEDRARCRTEAIFLPVAVQLMRPVDLAAFKELVAALQPVLVIVDTLARVTVGAEENSTTEMGRFVDAADDIRMTCGSCVLIVHHEPRGAETMRGAIALEGAATSVFRADRDGITVTLENKRQKEAAEADKITLQAARRLDSVVIESNRAIGLGPFGGYPTDSEKRILDTLLDCFLDSDASASTLMEITGQSKSTFFHAINSLVSGGKIVREGAKGRYRYSLPIRPVQSSPTESNAASPIQSKVQPPL